MCIKHKIQKLIIIYSMLSQPIRRASVLLCLTVDKTSQHYTRAKAVTPILKKKKKKKKSHSMLASCSLSLDSLHCPKPKHKCTIQFYKQTWNLKVEFLWATIWNLHWPNLSFNLQVWIFVVLNLLLTLSRLKLKCNFYKIFTYSSLLNMLYLFLNIFLFSLYF